MKIISKVDGYRRCGVIHPARPVEYPDDAFSPEQVSIMKADPLLTVEGPEKIEANLDPEFLAKMTQEELTKLATDMGLKIPEKANKKQLVDLIASEPVTISPENIQEGDK